MDWNKFKKINYKKHLYNIFIGKTIARKIFMFYLYAIALGVLFLSLPISLQDPGYALLNDGTKQAYDFIDSFFTTVSAFTDTGLTTLNVVGTYNVFGQFVILFLIQIGGLGLFTLYWMFWNALFNNIIYKKIKKLPLHESRNMSFSNSLLIASERGNTKLGLSMKTIKSALIFILISELVFAAIYSLMFYFIPSYQQVDFTTLVNNSNLVSSTWYVDSSIYSHFYHNAGYSIWSGIFQSISTMNNAGFDIISQASYSTFRNGIWTILLYISSVQIIIGGIGYPVIYDIIQYTRNRHYRQKFKFSLFTKVSTITYFLVFLVGLAFVVGFEYGLPSAGGLISTIRNNSDLENVYFGTDPKLRIWNEVSTIIFNIFSARSAGISTVSQSTLSYGSIWIINILMFIGCAPSSTGGGIRTTTLAIIFMTGISYMRGQSKTTIFKKVIPNSTVITSAVIILTSVVLVFSLALISYPLIIQSPQSQNLTITDVLFEFSSAYGTVGLSTGLSSILNAPGTAATYVVPFLLCIIMIVGQLGVSTTIFAFRSKDTNKAIEYAQEDIRI